ncbi:MAG TPA: hypothetical protein VHR41_07930 [Gemmatimonadales bacterium]|nr:hypothetical protein [Gemmatimonadales bacterium]
MKIVLVTGLGLMAIVSLTAFARVVPATHRTRAFTARLTGAAAVELSGDATFARVEGGIGAPTVFTLDLGQGSAQGAILFTRSSGSRLSLGTYTISDRGDGSDDLQALVMLGAVERPTGVFRAQSGTLRIDFASDTLLTGSFTLAATGFTAADPATEDREMSASGRFTARGR